MLTRYESGAEVEAETVARYESGAEVEAEGVYRLKDGAEAEVWSSGYAIGYTLGGFPDGDCSLWAHDPDFIRMGYKLGYDEPIDEEREIGIWIYGNFVNPVISCDVELDCGTVQMSINTACMLTFYIGDTDESSMKIVGYTDSSKTPTGSLNNHEQRGTFDKIFLSLRTWVENADLRSEYVVAYIKNLTIDGKKIKSDLKIGDEATYN